jgi:hypothetical protein
MAYIYLNFSRNLDLPWAVTETNSDRTQLIKQTFASDLEVNVQCKTFVGKFHYLTCEGEIEWQGTKAVINPLK